MVFNTLVVYVFVINILLCTVAGMMKKLVSFDNDFLPDFSINFYI